MGSDGFKLFSEKKIVAMKVNGQLRDLAHQVAEKDVIEGVHISSKDGLDILRHSTAHVLAQAVQSVNPKAKLGFGPPITDGFYYDFDVADPFTPEDLKSIEKTMQKIIQSGQRFVRRVSSDTAATAELAGEPYKLELINLKASDLGEASVEVGAGELTIYDNIDPQSGNVVWKDLCRGPHLPNTRMIGSGFALTRVASAYWRGNENNKQLQRIYGTAWPSKEELREHQERLEEAAKRDHRKLGVELDLFSFPEEIGSGLAVFHPRGGVMRRVMEDYSRTRHEQAGYDFVYSPHISKSNLFEISGHLQTYADGMFPPIRMDEELAEDGTVKKVGQDYYLKPMNCPFHILIYRSQPRSYRDLPLRMFEFGTVYRNEKSGVLHGLTRVRGLTMDDAHLFVTQEDMKQELTDVLQFILGLLKDYGLSDFYLELSTREEGNPKFVGSSEIWDTATETLAQVAAESGLELVPDPGGAAFYGPKISVQARDAIGRTWQMSTVQLDFNLPERFDLEYTASDGTKKTPVMIHRALFGSVERFFGVLTEHYAGHFPPWLAPVQVMAVPIAEAFSPYLHEFVSELRSSGVRAQVDDSDDRMQKKIRNHTLAKVPFMLIAGAEDVDAGAVSFRFRDGSQENGIPLAAAKQRILEAISQKVQV
ncbi:MAG: threonine--tRNA ligase [Actinobacteria bacterium]|nr:threonine--tRNA ligase [Actinomycetota bacterium]